MNEFLLDILLVDDNEQEYAYIDKLLSEIEDWQYQLEQVPSYELALEKLKQTAPDVCLLNPTLPENNGYNHLHKIFQNNFNTALILLTPPDVPPPIEGASDLETIDSLVKGEIDAAQLQHSVHYALQFKKLKQGFEQQLQEQIHQLTTENRALRKELIQWKHEAAVREEKEGLYQDLFNVDIYGVEVLDGQGIITDCNITYQNMLGYRRNEILGHHTTDFATEKDKRRLAAKFSELRGRGYTEGEIELVGKGGTTLLVWRRLRATHDDQGNFTGAVVYSRDITERMKAVRQISTLARALEQSPIAILIMDQNGLIDYANFRFSELSGYSYEDVVGQPLSLVKSNAQSPEAFQEISETIAAGDEWRGEFYNLSKEGEAFWEDLYIVPMFSSQGTVTHYIATQEDITARKQIEEETRASQKRVGDLMSEQIGDLTTSNEQLAREVNERKRVETELRRSRARLKAQYKGIPLPTYSWQKSGDDLILVDYNDVAEKDSQGRIVDFIGKPVGEVFQNDPQVIADFEHCFREKTTVKREAPYQLVTTGEVKYFVTTYNYVPPHLVIVHIQDVTERRQLEEEIKTVQKQLEDAPDPAELAELKQILNQEVAKRQQLKTDFEAYQDRVKEVPPEKLAELEQLKSAVAQESAQRQELKKALRESEEKFQQIAGNIDDRLREQYRSIPVPTYSWQRIQDEFVLVDFNDAAAQNMGRIVDFFGKSASEIFAERPEVLADFDRSYQEKSKVVREAPYKMITTGETRFFVTTYNFVPPTLVIVHIQDITQQKEMEAELKAYHRRYEALKVAKSEGSPEAMALLQQERDRREKAEEALDALQQEIKIYHDQLEDVVKDRTLELQEINTKLQQEIIEHQQAEESLREARVRLKAQYKGIPVPTYSWRKVGDDFVLMDFNQAAEKSSQGRINQFMGKQASGIFKDRAPVLANFFRCYNERKSIKHEAPYRLITTGETRHFITTYNYAPPNLVIVYIQDVTEMKALEQMLYESIEQVELNCRLSSERTITYVNDAFCWYFDESREHLLGRRMPFVLDEERSRVRGHFAKLSQKNPVGSIEYRIEKPDGSIRWQRWTSRAIFNKQGQLVEYRSSGKDVTYRQKPTTSTES